MATPPPSATDRPCTRLALVPALALVLAGLAPGLPARPDTARAVLLVEQDAAVVTLYGAFTGAPGRSLSYRLDVSRSGPSGTSTTRQSGAFVASGARPDTLARVAVNVRPGDRLAAHLLVLAGPVPVAADSVARRF